MHCWQKTILNLTLTHQIVTMATRITAVLKQCQQENGHLNLTNYSHAEMTIEALLVPCCCHMMVLHSGMQLNLIKSLIFMAVLFFLFFHILKSVMEVTELKVKWIPKIFS